jgi:hypothetical protein
VDLSREPIVVIGASVTAFVLAVVALLNIFAITNVTVEQTGAIVATLGAMWLMLATIRQFVTPAASPQVKPGTAITVEQPGNTPNTTIVAE